MIICYIQSQRQRDSGLVILTTPSTSISSSALKSHFNGIDVSQYIEKTFIFARKFSKWIFLAIIDSLVNLKAQEGRILETE